MLLPPLDPEPALFGDYVIAYNRIVFRAMRYARASILPAVANERRNYGDGFAFVARDDASTIGLYIEELRRELEAAERLARDAIEGATAAAASRHTKRWTATVAASANIDVGLLVRDDDLIEMLSYRVQEHVSLIKSLSTDMATRIERLALGSILEGRGNRETAKLLTEIEGIGRNRAKLIARDQANKLNGAMNQFRQEQAGITHYKWRTTIDGRERPAHHARNGLTFAWDAPPSDGHPGRAINCRCRALAIVIDDDEILAPPSDPDPHARSLDLPQDGLDIPGESAFGASIKEAISTVDMYQAVDDYTGHGYVQINGYLREVIPLERMAKEAIARLEGVVKQIDAAIAASKTLPAESVLYRGVSRPKAEFASVKVGDVVTDVGFASTTRKKQFAHMWAQKGSDRGNSPVVFVINAGGRRGLPIYALQQLQEGEVILPRGTRLLVTKIEEERVKTWYGYTVLRRIYVDIVD